MRSRGEAKNADVGIFIPHNFGDRTNAEKENGETEVTMKFRKGERERARMTE